MDASKLQERFGLSSEPLTRQRRPAGFCMKNLLQPFLLQSPFPLVLSAPPSLPLPVPLRPPLPGQLVHGMLTNTIGMSFSSHAIVRVRSNSMLIRVAELYQVRSRTDGMRVGGEEGTTRGGGRLQTMVRVRL